jgi:hypothetical protein
MAIAHYQTTISTLDWIVSGVRAASINVGNEIERALIVLAYLDRGGATTINGATYAGATMTARPATIGITGNDYRLFYLANPAAGANTLTITASDDNSKLGFIASIYAGVNQTAALTEPTDHVTSRLATQAYTADQTTNAGETVVFMAHTNDSGGSTTFFTPYGSMTERLDNYGFVADIVTAGASETVGFTPTGTMVFSGVSFGLVPAGAATGIPKTTKQTLLGVG